MINQTTTFVATSAPFIIQHAGNNQWSWIFVGIGLIFLVLCLCICKRIHTSVQDKIKRKAEQNEQYLSQHAEDNENENGINNQRIDFGVLSSKSKPIKHLPSNNETNFIGSYSDDEFELDIYDDSSDDERSDIVIHAPNIGNNYNSDIYQSTPLVAFGENNPGLPNNKSMDMLQDLETDLVNTEITESEPINFIKVMDDDVYQKNNTITITTLAGVDINVPINFFSNVTSYETDDEEVDLLLTTPKENILNLINEIENNWVEDETRIHESDKKIQETSPNIMAKLSHNGNNFDEIVRISTSLMMCSGNCDNPLIKAINILHTVH